MKNWTIQLLVLLSAVLGGTGTVLADLATDHSRSGDVYLYYFDGRALVRTNCSPTTIIRDRAICIDHKYSIDSFESLRNQLEEETGALIPSVQARIEQRYIKIQQIDGLLIEHLAGISDLADELARLRREITRREGIIADFRIIETDLKLQIQAVEDEIRTNPDPDLFLLLEDLKTKLAENSRKIEVATFELARVREQFIATNGSIITDVTFRSLVAQRDGQVTALENDRRIMDGLLVDVSSVRQMFGFVLRPLVTYDVIRAEPGYDHIKRHIGKFELYYAQRALMPLEAGRRQLQSDIRNQESRIAELKNEHAAETGWRRTLEAGVGQTYYEKVFVSCKPQSGSSFLVDTDIVLRTGSSGAADDAAIDKLIADFMSITEDKFKDFLTLSSCRGYFVNSLPWALRLSASLKVHNQMGSGYTVKSENGTGMDCEKINPLSMAWWQYKRQGGHTRAREAARLHAENLAKAAELQLQVNLLKTSLRALDERISRIQRDS